jgi:hypothetical protein
MSVRVEHIIESLVHDDMDDLQKLKKVQLIQVVKQLKADLYRELRSDTLQDLYDNRFSEIL